MTPEVRRSFLDTAYEGARALEKQSATNTVNGHWMRAAATAVVYVGGKLWERDVINAQVVDEMLEKDVPKEIVRDYARDEFLMAFKKLGIN